MFHKNRRTSPKVFCKNDVFKGFTKFRRKHLCQRLVLKNWKNSTLQAYQKDTPAYVLFCEFLRTPILNNFCEGLHTNLFYENKPPAQREKKDNNWSICQVWCWKYLCLLKQIWFRSSLTFLRDLHWPIKFQILCDRTINSSYIYTPKHQTN